MLLKSIKLVNFRQFINESIDFAEGKDGKNVTIILGENGTGKTTFAQAFFWCLYGDTEFSDKIMLNRKVANDMRPGQEEKVIVTLRLRHGEVEYTIVREQAYHKDFNGKVRGDNTIIDIAYKGADGQRGGHRREDALENVGCADVGRNIVLPLHLIRGAVPVHREAEPGIWRRFRG